MGTSVEETQMTSILLLLALCGRPVEISGRVVGVSDGDSLTLLVEQKQVKVRLASIDAPEKRQPFGQAAKSRLSELVFGKDVRVVSSGSDRYGRTIGRVFVGETDVNAALVNAGLAWQYWQYDKSVELWQAELDSREAHRGLWADRDPVPPWEWRKGRR